MKIFHNTPLKIAFLYIIVAGAWIVASDYLTMVFIIDSSLLNIFQTYKGLLFVVTTGVILYAILALQYRAEETERVYRHDVELQLKDSGDLYKLLFENSGEALLLTDPSGGIYAANPAACAMFGMSESEICSAGRAGIVDVHDPRLDKVLEERKAKGSYEGELNFKRSDGTIFAGEISTNIFKVHDGSERTSMIIRDLTERKRSEKALRESESKFSMLFDKSAFTASLSSLPDGILVAVNEAFVQTFGFAKEEALGNTPQDLGIHPDVGGHERISRAIKENESIRNLELTLQTKSVGERIFSVNIDIVSIGDVQYVLNTSQDITDRKKAQEELRASEERFRLAFETSPDSIAINRLSDGIIVSVNKGFTQISGYTKEEVIGKTSADINSWKHPEDRTKFVNEFRAKGEVRDFEAQLLTKNGEIYGLISASIIELMGVPHIVGITRDITVLKQAEEKLREREYLLSSSQRVAHVGTWSWKIGDTTTYWSDETYRIYGLNPAMGAPSFDFFFEIIHPDDRPKMQEWPTKVIAGLHPPPIEFRVMRPDGIYRVIQTEGDVIETLDGVPSRIAGTAFDITERKQAEEEFRILNERISTATKASKVGIWDWDIEKNQLNWDDQMYMLYGIKKEEFAGAYEAWLNGLHPDDKVFGAHQTEMALKGEKEYDTEFRIIWPDGSVRYCKAKGEVFRNEKGEPIRMVGINYDITEQKRIDEKIREKDQEFRKLSDNVPDLIFQFTRTTNGSYCVPIASKGIWNIFGCTAEEVLDDFTPIGRVIHPDDAKQVLQDIEYSAQHLTPFACEFRVQIPGREMQWIYSKSTPERLPDGSTTWYGFNTDITYKKLAEESLKENISKLELAMQTADMAWWEMEITTGRVNFDKRKSEMIGFPADNFKHYTDFTALLHPEDYDQAMKSMKNHIEGKTEKYETEYRILTNTGEYKWFYDIGSVVRRDRNGLPLNVVGFVIDITRRKRTDEKLRESENLFRKLYEDGANGMVMANRDFKFLKANKTFCQLTGYLEEELQQLSFADITHPDDRAKDLHHVKKMMSGETDVYRTEKRYVRKDGQTFWAQLTVSPINDINGQILYFVGIIVNVTDHKVAENRLAESEERFRKAFEDAPLGVAITGLIDKQFKSVNHSLCEMLGYTEDELMQLTIEDVTYPDDRANDSEVVRNLLEEKIQKHIIEKRYVRKNGEIIWGLLALTKISNTMGKRDYAVTMIKDITDRKHAEEELRKLNEDLEKRVKTRTIQLEDSYKEMEAFSYSVSHDLRAPLRGIDGWSLALQEEYGTVIDEKGQTYLNTVRSETQRMGRLIDDMLNLSRLSRTAMRIERVELSDLAASIASRIQKTDKKRSVQFRIEQGLFAQCDITLMEVVLTNLFENAFKFTSQMEQTIIEFGRTELNGESLYYVRDNGAGFDMTFADKLFKVFQRLHKVSEFPGTGVGLAIVQRIIHRHGGRVWADSKINEGATFYFTLKESV